MMRKVVFLYFSIDTATAERQGLDAVNECGECVSVQRKKDKRLSRLVLKLTFGKRFFKDKRMP
jgi:hypothetical protein